MRRLEGTPGSLGIVAFEQLDPRMKALTVDGFNVLSNDFQVDTYPLAVTLTIEGTGSSLLAPLLQGAVQPATNRDAIQADAADHDRRYRHVARDGAAHGAEGL